MDILLTPRQMADMERRFYAASGTRSIALMERAAREFTNVLLQEVRAGETAFFACGPGGNGGDGLASARMAQQAGVHATAVLAGEVLSPDARENLERARLAGVRILPFCEWDASREPDVWIDALYGTGLSRAPEGAARELIRAMNRSAAPVYAVDIPSGLDGLSGAAYDPAVRAKRTVSFQTAKTGHFLADGLDRTGRLTVRDIGIPDSLLPEDYALLADAEVLREEPRRNVHKGVNGHLLLIAGSVGMAGAAALAAGAALKSGAGLVTVACPEEIVPVVQVLAPCAMCAPLPSMDGALSPEAARRLPGLFAGKRAVAVGCGLSGRCAEAVVRCVLESDLCVVLDADALNLIAKHDLCGLLAPRHVITPHPGEARRLLGRAPADPLSDARALAEWGCTAVLKGASRVICAGRETYVSATGAAGMAKGGSGDVFTGVVGAVLCRDGRVEPGRIAAAAEIHGLAGALAQKALGSRGMTARDILDRLPEAFLRYES